MKDARAWFRVLMMVFAMAAVAAACGDGDGEGTPDGGATEAAPASTADEESDRSDVGTIQFLIPNEAYDPVRTQIGLMLVEEWKKLGLDVQADTVDYAGMIELLTSDSEDYDAFIAGYGSDAERFDPGVLLRQPFHCDGIESGTNYARYCNPEYDALIEEQGALIDPEARLPLVHEAQEILREDLPAVPLYHLNVLSAWDASSFTAEEPFKSEAAWYWWVRDARPVGDETTLRMGQTFDIGAINPFTITEGGNVEYLRLIYDTLTEVTPTGEIVPRAAESWEYTDDTTLVVNLRDDLVFHDGEPLTADDVVYSFDLFGQGTGQAATYETFLTSVDEVIALDDHTVEISLTEPYAPLVGVTLSQILILPEHIWSDVKNVEDFDNQPAIGSGPFVWGEWRRNQEVHLTANPDYFDPPEIDAFLGVTYSNADAVFRALANQEIHIHQASLLTAQFDQLAGMDHIETSELPDIGVYYLAFNTASGPMADLALRKALSHTPPYEQFMETLFDGHVTKGYSFIAPANEQWSHPNLPEFTYDIDAARTILEEAGYSWEGDTLLAPSS